MLPTSIKVDNKLAKFLFLNKLPSELQTREAIQIFEDRGTFEDLMKECHAAYQQALWDQSNKQVLQGPGQLRPGRQRGGGREDEPAAVNLVNMSKLTLE